MGCDGFMAIFVFSIVDLLKILVCYTIVGMHKATAIENFYLLTYA